jgi:two-component system, response regulator
MLIELLLAEDNPSDAELIVESLARHRLAEQMHVARDGEEALDFLFARGIHAGRPASASVRLVLLDLKLPKIGGHESAAGDPGRSATQHIPVVMLTSSRIETDVSRSYALGADSYVQKPVDFVEFRRVVQHIGNYWLRLNEAPPASTSR